MSAEPPIQDEESLLNSKSKSSRCVQKKGSSVAHASETDLGLLQQAAKWRQELTSLIAAEPKLYIENASKIIEQAGVTKQLEAWSAKIRATSAIPWRFTPCIVIRCLRRLLISHSTATILPFDNIRLGSRRIVNERVAMHDLVRIVHSKLNAEDAALLSDGALRMIFRGGRNTVHQEGNDEDMLNPDVLEMGLNPSQLEYLKMIYEFTHIEVPQL